VIGLTKSSAPVSVPHFCTITGTVSSGRSAAICSKPGWARGTPLGASTTNGRTSAKMSKTLRVLPQSVTCQPAISFLTIRPSFHLVDPKLATRSCHHPNLPPSIYPMLREPATSFVIALSSDLSSTSLFLRLPPVALRPGKSSPHAAGNSSHVRLSTNMPI